LTAICAAINYADLEKVVVAFYWSPLRSLDLPGPWWSKFTKIPITLKELAGYLHAETHALHLKYGPVVQLGPDEISFMTPGAIRDIYTGPGCCEISDAYNKMGNKGQMFISRDPVHRDKKRRITHMFSVPSMNELEPSMQDLVNKQFDIISTKKGEPINMLYWDRMLNLDLAGRLFFPLDRSFVLISRLPGIAFFREVIWWPF